MMKSLVLLLCLQAAFPVWSKAENLFAGPCARMGIPQELALAIARQESGLYPLAVNVAGKSYHPASREEAEKIIRMAQAEEKSFDVGIMQINSQWHRKLNIDPVSLLDPETNIRLGLYILDQEIKRHGFNWLAVGKYHSPNPERGRLYAWRVFRRLEGGGCLEKSLTPRTAQISRADFLHDSRRIWRNPSLKPKGRIVTFRVREAGLPREQNHQQGGSPIPARASESER